MARSGVYEAEVGQGVVITPLFVVDLTTPRYCPALAAPPAHITIALAHLSTQLRPVIRQPG
jgi:hypothetical protein